MGKRYDLVGLEWFDVFHQDPKILMHPYCEDRGYDVISRLGAGLQCGIDLPYEYHMLRKKI